MILQTSFSIKSCIKLISNGSENECDKLSTDAGVWRGSCFDFCFRYRNAGAEIIDVLARYCACVERASIDEAYLDLTAEVEKRLNDDLVIKPDDLPNTIVAGLDSIKEAQAKGMDLCDFYVRNIWVLVYF